MADTKISALTASTSLADTDELVLASSGANKKITGANLKASMGLTLLSSTTLGSAGTFDVSSIPGTYNDLILVLIARGTNAGAQDNARFIFNNDTGANYYWERMQAEATTLNTTEQIGTAFFQVQSLPAAGATANHFGIIEMRIFGYASTTWKKICQWESHWSRSLSTGDQRIERGGALWNSTAALNRVTIQCQNTANFVTGSQLRIYGRL